MKQGGCAKTELCGGLSPLAAPVANGVIVSKLLRIPRRRDNRIHFHNIICSMSKSIENIVSWWIADILLHKSFSAYPRFPIGHTTCSLSSEMTTFILLSLPQTHFA